MWGLRRCGFGTDGRRVFDRHISARSRHLQANALDILNNYGYKSCGVFATKPMCTLIKTTTTD